MGIVRPQSPTAGVVRRYLIDGVNEGGLKVDDVKYVAVGHLHLDHGGNVGQFKNSTLIAQDDEFKAAWWPDVGYSLYYIPGDFADAKNMKLLLFAGDHGCWVDGDSIRLERAMANLLGNAIKFSPPGSSISVSLDRGRHFARISVHDECPGISDDGKARIFEVFQREEETAHLPGLGLGLFITKQIAESHGDNYGLALAIFGGAMAVVIAGLTAIGPERKDADFLAAAKASGS